MVTTQANRGMTSRLRVRLLVATFAGFVLVGVGAGGNAVRAGSTEPTLQGFTTNTSVSRGQVVHFKIETDALAYSITIYQLGESGALPVASLPTPPAPQLQPPCLPDSSTGLVDCSNWSESASWAVPADAVPGLYVARLARPDTVSGSEIVFVVQDDSAI
jgi:N,N-dimethylformamidase beta subunit-like protein